MPCGWQQANSAAHMRHASTSAHAASPGAHSHLVRCGKAINTRGFCFGKSQPSIRPLNTYQLTPQQAIDQMFSSPRSRPVNNIEASSSRPLNLL